MFEKKDVKPMLLKETPKPFDSDDYIFELKFDGYRVIIYVSKDEFVIRSRNNKDITFLYPELKKIQNVVGNNKVIFDGEIVALDNGKISFANLQKRGSLKDKKRIENVREEIPVFFVVFDILYNNKELIKESLVKRKEILNRFKDNDVFIKSKVFDKGKELFKLVKKQKLEGIVAKKKNSLYIPNKRVDFWLKIKNFKESYFFVHAYSFNKEKYSLYLGEFIKNKLYFVGKVSTTDLNFVDRMLKMPNVNNMFINCKDNVMHIKPMKVVVRYLERSADNKLRHPVLIFDD